MKTSDQLKTRKRRASKEIAALAAQSFDNDLKNNFDNVLKHAEPFGKAFLKEVLDWWYSGHTDGNLFDCSSFRTCHFQLRRRFRDQGRLRRHGKRLRELEAFRRKVVEMPARAA